VAQAAQVHQIQYRDHQSLMQAVVVVVETQQVAQVVLVVEVMGERVLLEGLTVQPT
jgi:hypothetical protein